MTLANKDYLLRLNRMPGVGPVLVQKLLRRWPALDELFCLSATQLVAQGFSDTLARTFTTCHRRAVDADLQWEMGPDCRLITWGEDCYPTLLREIAAPPPVLYARGQMSCLDAAQFAIVGTRNPSATGKQIAKAFSAELAAQGLVIVSGLARGIDGQAHEGALSSSGKTVAVMATGIDCIYPRQHLSLAERISANGVLLSEFPLKSPPIAGHFPRRNRIISGLSMATLVVESGLKSGTLVTARYAMEQNRDVFAVPGCIYNPQTRGCHQLLQQGAVLVTSVQDILAELNWAHCAPEKASVYDESALMQYMGDELYTVDQLILRSGLCMNEVISELTELELNGLVHALPGGYMRCRV
jgi:DNA processing protein